VVTACSETMALRQAHTLYEEMGLFSSGWQWEKVAPGIHPWYRPARVLGLPPLSHQGWVCC